jgi:hypothetical protein
VGALRDYEQWHRAYDDPASSLSWRLGAVQGHIRRALDEHAGPVRIVSACAGDGRDVLGVLSKRPDAARVTATLIELHPSIAKRAAKAAADITARVEVRTLDAGFTDAYIGAVPADLVMLVGIFGNITDADVFRTIEAAPQLCRPGTTLLWSRGQDDRNVNDEIRARFAAAHFLERDYTTLDVGSRPAIGAVRYEGPPAELVAGQHLFTFVR